MLHDLKGKVIDGSSKIVLDFLSSHEQAFTRDEIIKEVNPHPTPEFHPLSRCRWHRYRLQGQVERRQISDNDGKDSPELLYYHAT